MKTSSSELPTTQPFTLARQRTKSPLSVCASVLAGSRTRMPPPPENNGSNQNRATDIGDLKTHASVHLPDHHALAKSTACPRGPVRRDQRQRKTRQCPWRRRESEESETRAGLQEDLLKGCLRYLDPEEGSGLGARLAPTQRESSSTLQSTEAPAGPEGAQAGSESQGLAHRPS